MSGYDDFEIRLEHALRRYGDEASMPFDPSAIAERAMGVRRAPSMWRALLVPALLLGMLLAAAIGLWALWQPDPPPAPSSGELNNPAGEMHSATLLQDGRILVLDGVWNATPAGMAETAEVWDPRTGSSTHLTTERDEHRVGAPATLLDDGRVLIAGGYDGTFAYASAALASTEIWDPTSQEFVAGADMLHARVNHTLTRLPDGRVLVAGGAGPGGAITDAEIFDPQTGTFAPAGTLAFARVGHTATLLQDGGVLIAGGVEPGDIGARPVEALEVWDPSIGSFREAGALRTARAGNTATLLADGRVLFVGGYVGSGYGIKGDGDALQVPNQPADFAGDFLASAEIWDATTGVATETGALRTPRTAHAASLLPDGRVVITGGMTPQTGDGRVLLVMLDTVEVWNPTTESWVPGHALAERRAHHSVAAAGGGHLVIVGGGLGAERLASVEVWASSE